MRCGAKGKLVSYLADKKGKTALHTAAQRDHTDVCALLLEAKADPTRRMALWGMTPLENARYTKSGRRRGGRAAAPIEALLGDKEAS